MLGTLKVEPDKLKSTAASFQATGNQIKSLTDQMTSVVEGLSANVWTGEAAATYIKKFQGLQDDIAKMIRMVNEHVTDLNEMASQYEQAEAEVIAKVNNLSSDVIV